MTVGMGGDERPNRTATRGYVRKMGKPGTSVFVVTRRGGQSVPESTGTGNGAYPTIADQPLSVPELPRPAKIRSLPGFYAHERAEHQARHFWLFVLCLTGVDYFSTLAYQPGIAFNATGFLSPIATAVLVAFTLAGALTVYRMVAHESPNGQGSISMLERLLHNWAS